jgi:uncharacterized protein with NRDE domain
MCTLAIYFRVFSEYPVVIAANRDEFLDRPALPPTTLADNPHVIGGKDLKAGGTWLGLNSHGLVCGLLNRRSELPANPNARSRGILTLEALSHRTPGNASGYVARQNGADYNFFNLLMASRNEAYVAYNRAGADQIEVAELSPGFHLLTNLDLDDFECPRISRSYRKFLDLAETNKSSGPESLLAALAGVLSQHTTELDARSGRPNALCMHLGGYGTRSSSILIMSRASNRVIHHFAAGPPCITAYHPAEVPRSFFEESRDTSDGEASDRNRGAGQED